MVVSQIRSLYRDKNDLLRTITKRIYKAWDAEHEQWNLKKVEYIFPDANKYLEIRIGVMVPPMFLIVGLVREKLSKGRGKGNRT